MAIMSVGVFNKTAKTIKGIVLDKPSVSSNPTYTGGSVSPVWNNYNANMLDISGDVSGVNAGSYTAVFVPKEGVFWQDGSNDPVNIAWSIGKATPIASINKTSVSLSSSKTSDTVTVTTNSDGAVSASSSNTSVASTSVSGKTVTIKSVNNTTGSASVSIGVGAGTNYVAYPTTMSVQVNAQFFTNPITGNITLGNTVTFDNKSWIVQHIEGNYVYLASKGILDTCSYNDSNVAKYANSTLAEKAMSYQVFSISADSLNYCQDVTVEGVTSKVFIPSKAQLETDWSWPKASASNRAQIGGEKHYWTSTPIDSNHAWHVTYKGIFSSSPADFGIGGFRPAVKVQFQA